MPRIGNTLLYDVAMPEKNAHQALKEETQLPGITCVGSLPCEFDNRFASRYHYAIRPIVFSLETEGLVEWFLCQAFVPSATHAEKIIHGLEDPLNLKENSVASHFLARLNVGDGDHRPVLRDLRKDVSPSGTGSPHETLLVKVYVGFSDEHLVSILDFEEFESGYAHQRYQYMIGFARLSKIKNWMKTEGINIILATACFK